MDTLYNLALSGCQSLEHLELQFNEDEIRKHSLPSIPDSGEYDHGLGTLGIITDKTHLGLTVHDKIAIATFLDRLFPDLQEVWGTAKEEWEEINAWIQSYQALRARALATYFNIAQNNSKDVSYTDRDVQVSTDTTATASINNSDP
ncbi:hypothetical protein FA15DRAFT_668539 [Coprinopsis marcescibilis]|uniref:Uncharacterized protein n=1 Tax=Coprinopsis marcescibilis TaxID=230819 RepID=A0A5C3KZ33_COPMA|nr:hypothetical protein FA15DRAFT_668539 [Coprinopsis marcescibilis]